MADVTRQHFFDLFGLAREIRDMIYSEALAGSKALQASDHEGVHLHVHAVPRTELLLANHRVQAEYTAMWIKTATLVVADHKMEMDLYLQYPLDFCERYGPVPCVGCPAGMELDMNLRWTSRLLQRSPSPRLLRVHLHNDAETLAETKSGTFQAYIARLAVLLGGCTESSFTVWKLDLPWIEHFNSHEHRRAIMRWDSGRKSFVDVEGATAEDVLS
ncbi:hypothetical protein LTR53_012291 [Teratosphaeriaceae sp. CCFEE 6253]|nr:hypothetical protein LTR53_012291 [Teratosphaeriaceae sp. CCFEE 6253]